MRELIVPWFVLMWCLVAAPSEAYPWLGCSLVSFWQLQRQTDLRGAPRPRLRHAAAIARGARARLPGKPMTLRDGDVVFEVDGLFLSVKTEDIALRVTVSGAPYDTAVAARRLGRWGDGVWTGDPAFDAEVRVDGPRLETIARLDAQARAAVREAIGHATLKAGTWRIDLHTPRYTTVEAGVEDVIRCVELLRAAAQVWVRPATPAASLARIAQSDPEPMVRAHALLLLEPFGPMLTVAREVAGAGLASSAPDQLAAAALIAQAEGTSAEVPALRAAAARLKASPAHDALREALELAIEAIQARVGAGSVGALSTSALAADLSAATEGGELALQHAGRPE